MNDTLCRLLDEAPDPARKHQIIEALLGVVRPCPPEDMNKAMLEIFAASGYAGYNEPSPSMKAGLLASIRGLQANDRLSWNDTIWACGPDFADPLVQALIDRSPFADSEFRLRENRDGEAIVHYKHEPKHRRTAHDMPELRNTRYMEREAPGEDPSFEILPERRKEQPARSAA